METRISKETWTPEPAHADKAPAQTPTRHIKTLQDLTTKAQGDPNILGYMVIGSVANGTHHEGSDIDVISVYRSHRPSSGINKLKVDGLVVDSLFMTQEVFAQSVRTVPYLLHTLVDARLLIDRENIIEPLLGEIREYFERNPEIEGEWKRYFEESKEVKRQAGCRASGDGKTIIDVWNELERRYSGGRIRRPFFNSFYLTNPRLFSLVKKIIVMRGGVEN
jgi:predicted nucleotidyltransferase